ncbi:MAG: hypothetical protein Q9199_006823 [Rusavskia elegans]
MRRRRVRFRMHRRKRIEDSSNSSARLGRSEVQAKNPIPLDPEFQRLTGDRPGGRRYDASNAAEFQDIRGKLSSAECIRLVEISSLDSNRTLLYLQFMEVRLDDAPDYRALSYTWGAPSTNPLSNIRGYRFTPNLIACLSVLMVQVPGLWWIDALCIDQDDPDEKSQQVKKMRDIYARAQQLYVWLGPIWNNGMNDGLAGLHLLVKIYHLGSQGDIDNGGPPLEFADDQLQKLGFPDLDSPIWRGLLVFLSRPYFKRMWVLQELAVAKGDILVMCGEMILPYRILYYAIHFMDRQGWRIPMLALAREYGVDYLSAFHFIDTITLLRTHHQHPHLRTHPQHHQQASLLVYLDTCRNYQSIDPRDKIIALLGIVSPDERAIKELEPDYSQQASD